MHMHMYFNVMHIYERLEGCMRSEYWKKSVFLFHSVAQMFQQM